MPIEAVFEPLEFERLSEPEQLCRSEEFAQRMIRRRSVRHFSRDRVPMELISNAIRVAGSAPSGANQQPWTFVVISDAALKREVRIAAEAEEKDSYERRMSQEWLDALAALGTDWRKTAYRGRALRHRRLPPRRTASELTRLAARRRVTTTITAKNQSVSQSDFCWPPCICRVSRL